MTMMKAARSTTTLTPSTPPEREERVTPWLLRRVKTPVTQMTLAPALAAQSPSPQKASTAVFIRSSPKPEPPAYHAVPLPLPQQQVHPSVESLAITTAGRGPAALVQRSQSQSSTTATATATAPVQPRTPPKPAVVVHRSAAAARGDPRETQRGPSTTATATTTATTTTSQHSGSPQLRSVRSAPREVRSRPGTRRADAQPLPVRRPPAAAVPQSQAERAHLLPSYHSAEPFPNPGPGPAPPPYRVSAEDSYPISVRSRSLPRSSRNKHGLTCEKKEKAAATTPLPPPPPPPPLPSQPQLSSSAISRIQAGFKVSKQFGDAIMQQELRLATFTSDHYGVLDPVPNPRLGGRRFLSTSQLSHHKAKPHAEKITPEHEARPRTSSKSPSNVGRCSGDSRQRATSAHSGRGQDKGSQRGRR